MESFICSLCKEVMTDPVAIVCGHSFERKAILEHFQTGRGSSSSISCPTCRDELSSLHLTPNVILRNSIQEWKDNEMDLKFETAVHGITSTDRSRQLKALEDMRELVEMPSYAVKLAEAGLILNLVAIFKDGLSNSTNDVLKCLHCLAKYSDDCKDAIVEAGAVRLIVKKIYKGEKEIYAFEVLHELSKRDALREKIGNTKDCIPLMVSLLSNKSGEITQKVESILQNLSSNTHFVVKMAEAGYFHPFVTRFKQGPQETRASMAAALTKMQLKENNIKDLKNKRFIHNLIQLLNSNSPACKSACLKCIKMLIVHPKMVKRFLSDQSTIPLLLGLLSIVRSDKKEVAEILALFIRACENAEFGTSQGLQELESKHNVSLFLQLEADSDPETKIQFTGLLLELSNKSETAKELIRVNVDAIANLFLSINDNEPEVRRLAMKLICCISEGNPKGVPLPPSPKKEAAINNLVAILSASSDSEEKSTAAKIISLLPRDDVITDEALRKSEALKAIHEVICSSDENTDTSLLENALAALLHFTEPTKPDLQRQVGKLEIFPSLVRVLTRGSSLAKQQTATALGQLSQTTSFSVSNTNITAKETKNSFFPGMCFCFKASSKNGSLCSVHGEACSSRETFCLIKTDAVNPLVGILSETEPGLVEAALLALETLFTDNLTQAHATAAIIKNHGLEAILQVLEKGDLSAKSKAIDIFQKMLNHTKMNDYLFQRSERIFIQHLHDENLKKKAALVLRQMNVIPDQSSYF
ncbi:hypothetical protein ACFE04_024800 [Oxalis oulophora]